MADLKRQKYSINIFIIVVCGLCLGRGAQVVLENYDNNEVRVELLNHLDNSLVIEVASDNAFLIEKDAIPILEYSQIENESEQDSSKREVHGTFNSNHDLKVKGDLYISSIADNLLYRGQKQWKLFEFDDFQSEKKGWSQQTISSCGQSENIFLGGHCNFGGLIVSKEFTNIPKNSHVMIQFNFHFFDDWNGELAFAQINGNTQWQESYTWCSKLMVQQCKTQGINTCGKDTPDRMSYPVSFQFLNVESSFILQIGTNLAKNPCEASWGIDDVQVYIR